MAMHRTNCKNKKCKFLYVFTSNKGIKKQVYTEKEFNILQIYQHLNDKNNHKMVPIPIFDLKENEII